MTRQFPFPEEVISKIRAFSAKAHPTALMIKERIEEYDEFLSKHPQLEAFYKMVPGAREHFYYRFAALTDRGWAGDFFQKHYYPRPNSSQIEDREED